MNLQKTLKKHKDEIERDAENGNEKALGIINCHQMWCAAPQDAAMMVFCEEYLKDWLSSRAND